MKKPYALVLSLALPLTASLLLTSCVSDGYYGGGHGGRYVTYATLPPNYSGHSYYYNNRYYAGGRYETGRYTYGGRSYSNRYYHNGRYIYGGAYRQYPSGGSYNSPRPRSSGGGYVTYTTVPQGYAGTTYYYNNRYYAGGRYETGRYTHQGRSYTGRYYHGGQYYYGGTPRQHAGQKAAPSRNQNQARNQNQKQNQDRKRRNRN